MCVFHIRNKPYMGRTNMTVSKLSQNYLLRGNYPSMIGLICQFFTKLKYYPIYCV